jgi:dolichol-phosphate mannosyltransferase
VVVVMDGDLQDPPEAIGPLWAKLQEGYDVVYAVRASRPEGWLKRTAYRAYYRLLQRLVDVPMPLDAGDFAIMSRRVVDLLNTLPERRRFVRGLRAWVGFRQTGLPIDRAPRHSGRPKFTISKMLGLGLDGLTGFSGVPLRCAGGLGLAGLALGMLGFVGGVLRAGLGPMAPPGWFWMAVFLLFSTGVQLLSVAILGEYVNRILQEVNGRPLYIVRRRIGLGQPPRAVPRARSSAR